MSLPPQALQKLLVEMNANLRKNEADLQMVNIQLNRRNNSLKLNELTTSELKKDKVDTVWKGCGKMFYKQSSEKYLTDLKMQDDNLKEQVNALNKKKVYIETTVKNTINGMNKIFGIEN
ncbi:prefolding complex chaperone subunit [Ascoidea rubescens DSM 1968]|uniref:Prefoldin subunit 1 n=1 Tax=Ascoidea rubescens DSM 1968 TaxID=1344418 RepID=A0A1D2VIM7_9ASCO|nr:Prefoldin subunit 1 [Ascoidea rubescens DSM 1968]ODV61496.1 Prefoldin subunit 1 [Ascoidea rubescens DSM 1968]